MNMRKPAASSDADGSFRKPLGGDGPVGWPESMDRSMDGIILVALKTIFGRSRMDT